MPIIAFQHHDAYRTGRLGLTLRDHGFAVETIRADKDQPPPPDLDDIDAVISLGGPQQTNEGHIWMDRERAYLKQALDAGLPVIGLGLGAQLMAEAAGGEVGDMEAPEAGFVEVEIVSAGQTETILSGIAWKTRQFMKHTRGVTKLPEGGRVLAKSARCSAQAFRLGMRSFGFQYHFECDRQMIDAMVADAQALLHRSGVTTQEFEQQAQASYERFARLADRLCLNLVNYAIPRVANEVRV